MKTLPLILHRYGFTYTQVLRGKRSCIYRQEDKLGLAGFEVFLIKVKPKKEILGKLIDEREAFPSNNDFSHWAWSPSTYEKALEIYKKLEAGEE
jgi:hypothetical protein